MTGILDIGAASSARFRLVGEKVHSGHDYFIKANSKESNVDFLIFLDSRGISRGFDESLVKHILECVGEKSYIAICRPINLTCWITLFNFLLINEVSPEMIVTNMGFVDFTPKKMSILDEVAQQIEYRLGPDVSRISFEQSYKLSSGETEDLYSMVYDQRYLESVQKIASRSRLVVLNTPSINRNIAIKRKRPAAFFSGIARTKEFNEQISGATLLDFGVFDVEQTYDAVHYTVAGNKLIMDQLEGYL